MKFQFRFLGCLWQVLRITDMRKQNILQAKTEFLECFGRSYVSRISENNKIHRKQRPNFQDVFGRSPRITDMQKQQNCKQRPDRAPRNLTGLKDPNQTNSREQFLSTVVIYVFNGLKQKFTCSGRWKFHGLLAHLSRRLTR